MRTHQCPDGRDHCLRHQHHLQPERTGDIHERRGARCSNARLNIAIAWTGNASQISHLLLRQSGGQPRLPQEVAEFAQGFGYSVHGDPYTIQNEIT